ncbi:bifunctional 2-polyprenyl-6-hydroxyphenol methylase/3-demethylubiquinol 3-O-methyltransferase UbiG [Methyloversatilis sp. XJ19-49]|uniref:class I SAM-dependent methyltransferase n=1 Tax=Methyloversatilis sp. XJ19-49 TaxID=2963429 RepID=UPI00211C971E|nr:methyltransferase domain-containing protein [Methyloversatilis sp. XJ19-49]MCQ9378577.1 methyltransferase domain-containing protein [Methyloversatilis sp. XJ19-49]
MNILSFFRKQRFEGSKSRVREEGDSGAMIASGFLQLVVPRSAKDFKVLNEGAYSPHVDMVGRDAAFRFIREAAAPGKSFLDVGGRKGERRALAEGYEYRVMDIDPGWSDAIVGDICSCAHVSTDSFDIVFSMNLLEHVADPWAAASEMVRIARPGGLVVQIVPFSWRYHPFPEDYWRFSHSGLRLLFEKTGTVETLLSGYDAEMRRKDQRGGSLPDNLDVPPIDELGGWREHWHALWVGRKIGR